MVDSIATFANSLKDYLVALAADSHDTANKRAYKYNNLKVFMDVKKVHKPHFFVSANISSVLLSLDPLEIVEGSMGDDDTYILRWASRPNILGELKKHYAYLSHAQGAISEEVVVDGYIVNEKKQTKEELKQELEQAADSITGSGIIGKKGA